MPVKNERDSEAYLRMLRIRGFEEAVAKLYVAGEISGTAHSSIGQEAAIVGACMALDYSDYMSGTHRSHGHPIGKGADIKPLMAEILGRATGVCKGRGGSMHLTDASVGSIGESAIVGGGISIAAGAALSAQVRGTDQVALTFFGDGAVAEGVFHECMNMAAIWKLPVIFFCENNGYAITSSVASSHGEPEIFRHAASYRIPGVSVDGQDFDAVFAVTQEAVERARRGEGPTLIEAKTYRFDEHSIRMFVQNKYRPDEEIAHYRNERDPLALLRAAMTARGATADIIESIEAQARQEIEDAVAFALESPRPEPASAFDYLYTEADAVS